MVKKEVKKESYFKTHRDIAVSMDTWEKLTALKVHPRQTYAEVVEDLIKNSKK